MRSNRQRASAIGAIGAISLLATAGGALAAPSADPNVSSPLLQNAIPCTKFGDALRLALDHDSRTDLAMARVARAESETQLERGADRPQISAFTRTGIGDGVQADNQLDNRFGVRVSQRLFSFGRGKLARDAAREREKAAQFGVTGTREEIAEETGAHFLRLARSKEEISAAELMNTYYRQAVDEVPRRLESGLLKQSEAAALQAEFARFEVQKSTAELDARRQLTQLTSLTGQTVICVEKLSAERALRTAQPPTLDAAISEANAGSPQVLGREAELAAAEFDRERISRSRLPDIEVAGTSAFGFGAGSAGFENNNRVGVDLNWPIYSGGQNGARTAAADAEKRIAASQLEGERRTVIEEVRLGWVSVRQLHEVVELHRKLLLSLVARSHALEREYDEGLITLTELIDARQEEFQGRLSDIDARYDLLDQQLILARHTGRMERLLGQD